MANHGAAETRQFFEGAYSAFPDLQYALTGLGVNTDTAVIEVKMTGTHKADMPGLLATDKPFSVRGATVLEIAGDKIRAVRDYWGFATFLRQVGLLAAPATS